MILETNGYTCGAISGFYSDFLVENSNISKNISNGILGYSNTMDIKNSIVSHNSRNGILSVFSDGDIDNNILEINGKEPNNTDFAGIKCTESNPLISNNKIIGDIENQNQGFNSRGIMCYYSTSIIKGNEFNNIYYGIVCLNGSSLKIKENKFKINGTAIISYSDLEQHIEKNIMSECYTGIFVSSSSKILNNLVSDCEWGMAFRNYCDTSISLKLINNTIINCSFIGIDINYPEGDDILFVNNIINGSPERNFYVNSGPSAKVSNSLIGDLALDEWVIDLGNNLFNIDPMLNDKFMPLLNSPCIDSGDKDVDNIPETDLNGNDRIIGDNIEIGAFEFNGN